MAEDDDEKGGMSLRQIVATVLLLGALVVTGLWITGVLRGASQIQDCVGAGRTNCAPIK